MHTPLQLQALTLMIQTVTQMRPLIIVVEGHDKDLARQIRRAANSVALNLAESQGSDRGNRKARLHTALGRVLRSSRIASQSCEDSRLRRLFRSPARETLTGFRLAVAWGYVGGEEAIAIDASLDRVAAMTWGLLRA